MMLKLIDINCSYELSRGNAVFFCLGDSVDGLGPLDADVGRGVARGLWPERADGAGHEDLEVVLLRQLHHVVQS